MRIIGYAYDADVHCISCTKLAHPYDNSGYADVFLVPFAAKDGEGNPVHPIFSTYEVPDAGLFCGDCREVIS